MAKSKKEKSSPVHALISEMDELLQKTANAMDQKKKRGCPIGGVGKPA